VLDHLNAVGSVMICRDRGAHDGILSPYGSFGLRLRMGVRHGSDTVRERRLSRKSQSKVGTNPSAGRRRPPTGKTMLRDVTLIAAGQGDAGKTKDLIGYLDWMARKHPRLFLRLWAACCKEE
jgi:hypothetical protein